MMLYCTWENCYLFVSIILTCSTYTQTADGLTNGAYGTVVALCCTQSNEMHTSTLVIDAGEVEKKSQPPITHMLCAYLFSLIFLPWGKNQV